MKKIIILLILFVLVGCKTSKNTNCDAYGSVSKATQK